MKIKNRFLRAFFNRCCGSFIFNQVYRYAKWKKFAISISFDVDSKEDHKKIPEILDIASSYNKIKFDFAVIGKWVERYPQIYKRIVEEGMDYSITLTAIQTTKNLTQNSGIN